MGRERMHSTGKSHHYNLYYCTGSWKETGELLVQTVAPMSTKTYVDGSDG